jgi:hypothetical protein
MPTLPRARVQRVRGGVAPTLIEVHEGDSISIVLSAPPSREIWTLDVYASIAHVEAHLGRLDLTPEGTRVVATATAPGCDRWIVAVNGPPNAEADIAVSVSPYPLAAAGVLEIVRRLRPNDPTVPLDP